MRKKSKREFLEMEKRWYKQKEQVSNIIMKSERRLPRSHGGTELIMEV